MDCASTSYKTTKFFLGIIGIVFGLGIPLYLFGIMRRRLSRETLFTQSAQSKIGVLTEVYRPRMYFWEVVVLLRRTLLLVVVFVNTNEEQTARMLFLVGSLTAVFLAVQTVWWPYRRASDNLMEIMVLFAHLLTALALSTADTPMTSTQSSLFALWVLFSTLLLVLALVAVKSLGWRRRRGHRMRLYLQNGDVDIRAVKVVSVDPSDGCAKRALSRVVECITCSPLAQLRFGGQSLDQFLATCLVSPRDFDLFRRGGGLLVGQTQGRDVAQEILSQRGFFGGLRLVMEDVFDLRRLGLLEAQHAAKEEVELPPVSATGSEEPIERPDGISGNTHAPLEIDEQPASAAAGLPSDDCENTTQAE
ncbi:MAG: hypothetical protein MHM6MM_002017 [Cercozoa sp. M6MM]